jgi:hypothetical protein
MPWGISRSAVFYEKEILVYPTGMEAARNIVIDGTKVPKVTDADGNPRYVVEAGTVIVKIEGSQKVKPAPEEGVVAADVIGIMHHTIEFFGNASSKYDEAGAVFFFGCIFDTTKLVNYTKNAAEVKKALTSCQFQ